MKKIHLILVMALVAFAVTPAHGQALTSSKAYDLLTGSTDSVVTTGTKYLSANLDGDIVGGSIVVKLTKSSGTARCTLTLQVSNDNSTWVDWTNGTSHTFGDKTITDTMLNTSGAQYFPFDLSNLCQDVNYVRVKCVGAGATGHTLLSGSYIFRRKKIK